MDPNSFKAKVIFSIIEKIVIGCIAALIVIYVQNRVNNTQKIRDEAAAITKINTGILITQRDNIMENMHKYLRLVEDVKFFGQAEKEQKRSLTGLRREISVSVFNIAVVYPEISTQAQPFLTSINEMNMMLKEDISAREEIETKEEEVLKNFKDLLQFLRKLTIKTIWDEFNDAHK